MLEKLNTIENYRHILLQTDSRTFANASALYSYFLQLHKKVSLYTTEPLAKNLSYLAWYEKCRETPNTSAEVVIEVSEDVEVLYSFFKKQETKINVKMATALYSGLYISSEAFQSEECNGTTFALASELIASGAEYLKVREAILFRDSLALVRLKAKLFDGLLLTENARHAKLFLEEKDLLRTGANYEDAFIVMKEALKIVHVQEVTLYDAQTKKIINNIQGNKI